MNTIKKAAIGLLERGLLKTATVLAVRTWEPATFLEVDLHMPGCDMSKWDQAQHMKCKVGPGIYRDYSPSGWDVETQTCTLFIDAAHEGAGSRWVKGLKAGDGVGYIGVASAHQQPVRGKRMIFLGDETSVGHFLALQQLAGAQGQNDIVGAIAIANSRYREEFNRYFSGLGLQALEKGSSDSSRSLEEWASSINVNDPAGTVFYLAGHIPSVVRLRKLLKGKGYAGSQIKAQGFWD